VCCTNVLCALVYNNRTRFWIIHWFLDIRGFGFGSEFSPELFFGWIWVLDLGYGFGCPDTTSDPNLTHYHLYTRALVKPVHEACHPWRPHDRRAHSLAPTMRLDSRYARQ
jgi:hypothetical protein